MSHSIADFLLDTAVKVLYPFLLFAKKEGIMKGFASLKTASLGAIKFRYLELPDTFFARWRGTIRVDDDLICVALVAHAGMDIARGKPHPIPLVKKESIVIFASRWPGQVNQEVRDRALLPYEPRRPKPRIAKFTPRAMNASP